MTHRKPPLKPMMRPVARSPLLMPPMWDQSFYRYWYRLQTSPVRSPAKGTP